ncbi:MAG: hypothetical protein COW01_06390 [Bdellovibrionales bacterium CG12_big_fil_rev_8_21_14_0_65_38_15]|nr:MAG: hypothetical protein COW79_10470 [Bdellovibrionales bacterium CG22_combo_CG10-13_8_21_14_all_38_13]PIQ55818.1 MAG: hypothetical protein COW01_06390 [Bdellovibrionales bacterium CG12_big_fil_rev_8_21_14_0_65_38_15]PIR28721.1 MAG: hypothetical protein COV38_14370 [Bdellovibrionales bacterium CG11_big_fil_rev_8_21_14_0_20_38_13]
MKYLLILLCIISCSSSERSLPRSKKIQYDDSYTYLIVPLEVEKKLEPEEQKFIRLINKKSTVINTWSLGFTPFYAQLDKDKNIYISGNQEFDQNKITNGTTAFLEKRSWDNKLLWRYDDKFMHHDFKILENGNLLLIRFLPIDPGKVGIEPQKSFHMGKLWTEEIIELNPETNKIIWSWKSHLHINIANEKSIDDRGEVFHANGIDVIDKLDSTGKPAIAISMRSNSTIYIIDKESKKTVWKSPKNLFTHQHDPSFINGSTLLVFNNSKGYSEVIEYDFLKNEVKWQYEGSEKFFNKLQFYSPYISGAQRLNNGNTLITLGLPGLLLEVNRDKNVVWNFFNTLDENKLDTAWPYKAMFKTRAYLNK